MKTRKLSVIMFTDIVGYTSKMADDEEATLRLLDKNRSIHQALIKAYGGQFLKEMGDGVLACFDSPTDAVLCAASIQDKCQGSDIDLRIGIHQGEVTFQQGDILGDGVNIASRIEAQAQPGQILVSEAVSLELVNKSGIELTYTGEFHLKNVDGPRKVYVAEADPDLLDRQIPPSVPAVRSSRVKQIARSAIIVLLAVLAFYFLKEQVTRTGDKSTGPKALAVLPFANLTGDPGLDYLSEGMVLELCNRLAHIDNLKVVSRMSGRNLDKSNLTTEEIAARLGVDYLIEGSVRRQSDLIAINAQLIDGKTQYQLASYDFNGRAEEALDAQINAALDIAKKLHLELKPEEKDKVRDRDTDDPGAYVSFLKGWMLLESLHFTVNPPTVEKLEGAKEHFERALGYDSLYALAYAGISMVESAYHTFNYKLDEFPLQRAEQMAKIALRLDQNLPEGHLAMGDIFLELEKYQQAIEAYETSLELNPDNPIAYCHMAYSCLKSDPKDAKGAEEAARRAIGLGATYIWSYVQLARALVEQEKYQEAIGAYENCIQLNSNWYRPYKEIGDILMKQGKPGDAITKFQQAYERRDLPWLKVRLAFAYNMNGQRSQALSSLQEGFDMGYDNFDFVESNVYLESLYQDDEFRQLILRYNN